MCLSRQSSIHLPGFSPVLVKTSTSVRPSYMHWTLQLADHFLHSILLPSYTKGNYLPLILPHLCNSPPQNLQIVESSMSINFKAPPKALSICVPDLTLVGSLTSSSNGPISASSLHAVPIPFNGGDSIPMQAYY